MQITVESREPARVSADLLAVPLFKLDPLRWKAPPRLASLDRALGGRISAAIHSGDFHGKRGESQLLHGDADTPCRRVLLLGMGDEDAVDAEALRRVAGSAVGAALAKRVGKVALLVPTLRRIRPPVLAQAVAEGAVLAAYRFERHKTRREEPAAPIEAFTLILDKAGDARGARAAAAVGEILATSQNVARDLSNEPANHLPPSALAEAAKKMAREVGLACRVLDVPELRKRKMGGILGVGQGSVNTPRLIVLEHGAPPKPKRRERGGKRPTLCIVGKGITFDSGGISIKPAASMHEMKHDMSGAATVVGAMRAVALLRLPMHVVGVIAAAENMPSATAYRPGDVLSTASGQTIEILNTDAEGRVVLADALHFARTEFEPNAIVDLATLTGACVVALGKWCSGLFSSDDSLAARLQRAGDVTGERVWRMPLWAEHREAIRSEVGDWKNTGGRDGGAITAAAFLWCFVDKTPWAHLDIAGTAWVDKPTPYQPRGATGVGVRLLVEWLRSLPARE